MTRKPRGYWTYNKCKKVALLCNSRSEFNEKYKSAYLSSYKNGWLNDICKHMEIIGHKYKRCIYSYEFPDKNVYVGLTYNLTKRQTKRNNDNNDKVTKYIQKTNLTPIRKQLTDYINVDEAQKLEGEIVNKYKLKGWNILNKSKTGGIGSNYLYWNFIRCKKEALIYNNRTDFKNNSCGAYYSSIKNNWLDKITNHMISFNKPKYKWDYKTSKKFALLCKNRKEFSTKYKSGYNASLRNKWLDDFFS